MRLKSCNYRKIIWLICLLSLVACDSIDTKSDNNSPLAVATASQSSSRAGSEILLSSRNSDDSDGVVFKHDWNLVDIIPFTQGNRVTVRASKDEQIQFIQDNNLIDTDNVTAKKFRIPKDIEEDTTYVFELTVIDDDGAANSDDIRILAKAIPDPDKFLTFSNAPDSFTIVSGTVDADKAAAKNLSFTILIETEIDYPFISFDDYDYEFEDNFTAPPNPKVYSRQINGTWPSTGSGGKSCNAINNQKYLVNIPTYDLDDLPFVDDSKVDEITTTVTIKLDALDAVNTQMCVQDSDGNVIFQDKPDKTRLNSLHSLSLETLSLDNVLHENLETAKKYYQLIDPDNKKTKLGDWLEEVEFNKGNVTEATYINGFDLGFGRHMFVSVMDNGEVYSYVINHTNLDSIIDSETGIDILATVAMEYSPTPGIPTETLNGRCLNCYTKFYTFIPDLRSDSGGQKRVSSFDFDGRGEKYQPGTCVACHGGQPNDLQDQTRPGDLGGRFLPWDVSTLFFSDEDYEQNPTDRQLLPTREQEEKFRKFNESVLLTIPKSTLDLDDPEIIHIDVRRTLIHGWYSSKDYDLDILPENSFDAAFIPPGWLPPFSNVPAVNSDDVKKLYLDVIAPTCRACHSQQDIDGGLSMTPLTFETYENFVNLRQSIVEKTFQEGTMPMARLTMDNFWADGRARDDVLERFLKDNLDIDVTGQKPGKPLAKLTTSDAIRHQTVFIDGSDSLYSSTFNWKLKSYPESSDITMLDSIDSLTTSFTPDTHGEWVVELTVENVNGIKDTTDATITVQNILPKLKEDIFHSTNKGVEQTIPVLDATNPIDGDPPYTLGIDYSSVTPGASVSIVDGNSINYTPPENFQENDENQGNDKFSYTVTDVDGDNVKSTVTVTIADFAAISDDAETVVNQAKSINVLNNDALGLNPVSITSVITTVETGGVIQDSTKGNVSIDSDDTIKYIPPENFTGTDTFSYQISDGQDSEAMAPVVVTVKPTVNYMDHIHNIWEDNDYNCISCHTNDYSMEGPAGNLLLNDESKDAIWDEIVTENRVDRKNASGSLLVCQLLNKKVDTNMDANGCSAVAANHTGAGSFNLDSEENQNIIDDLINWIQQGCRKTKDNLTDGC